MIVDRARQKTLRIPSGMEWPLQGLEADGTLIVHPWFRERLALENSVPVSDLTDALIVQVIAVLYIDLRLNGSAVTADGEHLLRLAGLSNVIIPAKHRVH